MYVSVTSGTGSSNQLRDPRLRRSAGNDRKFQPWERVPSIDQAIDTFDKIIIRMQAVFAVSFILAAFPGEYFPPHRLKRLDRYAQFAVASVKLALRDSGLEYSADNPQERVGVSFGTALGGVSNAESLCKQWAEIGPPDACPAGLRRVRAL